MQKIATDELKSNIIDLASTIIKADVEVKKVNTVASTEESIKDRDEILNKMLNLLNM